MSRQSNYKSDEDRLPALEQSRCSSLAAATLVYERPLLCIGGSFLRRDEFVLVMSMSLAPLSSARSLEAEACIELYAAPLCPLLVLSCLGMDETEVCALNRERTLFGIGDSFLKCDELALVMSMSLPLLLSARSLEAEARTVLDVTSRLPLPLHPRFGTNETKVGALEPKRTLLCISGSFLKCDELPLVMSMSQTPLVSARSLVADACIVLDVTSLLSLPLHPRFGTNEAKVGELEPKRTLLCISGSLLHRDELALSKSLTPIVSDRSLVATTRIELDTAPHGSLFVHPRCWSG